MQSCISVDWPEPLNVNETSMSNGTRHDRFQDCVHLAPRSLSLLVCSRRRCFGSLIPLPRAGSVAVKETYSFIRPGKISFVDHPPAKPARPGPISKM